jgi:hypothetical protein
MMKKQHLTMILFFGAIWGLLEATLGYLLQFLPPLVSGSIMFPIGATLLIYAYKNTGSRISILYVGLIAASIKAVNFFMPGLIPIKTYNPMIAIMLQSLAMIIIIPLFNRKEVPIQLLSLGAASILWRVMFLLNISVNHQLTGFNFPQLTSISKMNEFIFIYGLFGAAILGLFFGFIFIFNKNLIIKFKPTYAISFSLLIISFVATYLL